MKIRLRYIALFLLLAFGVPGIVGAVWFSAMVQGAGPLQAEKIVYIPSGSSIKKIARVMEQEGALEMLLNFGEIVEVVVCPVVLRIVHCA